MSEQNTLTKTKWLWIVPCEHENYSGHEDKHTLKLLKIRHYVVNCIKYRISHRLIWICAIVLLDVSVSKVKDQQDLSSRILFLLHKLRTPITLS